MNCTALQDAIVQAGEGELLPWELFSLRFTLEEVESGHMWKVSGAGQGVGVLP
jgi:hypothetical protein